MSRHRMIIVPLGLIAILLLAGVVVAQVSGNFDLHWSLLAGGGGQRQSSSYIAQDSLGQWSAGSAASSAYRLDSGFWPGVSAKPSTPAPTSTPTPTGSPTATSTPTSTPTATPTSTLVPPPGDVYEPDNTCAQAHPITVDAPLAETHNFNVAGDQDWIRFTASANRTFILQVSNTGALADPVVLLYDACEGAAPPFDSKDDPFGPSLRMEWDGEAGKTYYIKLIQHNPSVSGDGTSYDVSVSQDRVQPAAPKNPRCAALSDTALSLQWDQPPDWDVEGYEVHWQQQGGGSGGAPDVPGAGNTYKETRRPDPARLV